MIIAEVGRCLQEMDGVVPFMPRSPVVKPGFVFFDMWRLEFKGLVR